MMGDAATNVEVTYDAYLALERSTNWKHEWIDGVAYATAGGTPTHSRLSAQMIVELARLLEERPCAIHTSDLKVRPEGLRFATYPDVAVVCGEAQTHADDPNAVTNPVVLVEVLSALEASLDVDRVFRGVTLTPEVPRERAIG